MNDHQKSDPKNKWEELSKRDERINTETSASRAEELPFPSREQLEDQLTALERQVETYKEKAVRIQADMENMRRRAERDVANAIKYGTEKLVADLLPIVDSLTRGLDSPEFQDAQPAHTTHIKSMREGLSLTLDLLHKTLIKHGIQVVDPKPGDPFNPTCHEAISVQQDAKAQSNTILQVMQKGYQLNDRVLRAAMVVVAA